MICSIANSSADGYNTNRNRETCKECDLRNAVTSVMKENKIMKMISRRDFLKASAVVGAAGVLTACGGSSASTAASSTAASTAAAAAAAAEAAAETEATEEAPAEA